MDNLVLKNKILLVLALPIIMILALSFESIYIELQEKNKIERTQSYLNFSIASSHLMHELQKERGYSAGYRASNGKNFPNELAEQRKSTNKKLVAFKDFLKNFDSTQYTPLLQQDINSLLNNFTKLSQHRDEITKLNLELNEVVTFYTKQINALLEFMDGTITFSSDGDIALMAQSYLSLANLKEKSGIERAVVSSILVQGVLSSNSFSKFSSLISAQNTYLENFYKSANETQIKRLNETNEKSAFKEVSRIRNIINSKTEKSNILSHMKETIGYGGLIHNFKNYILRKDKKYEARVQTKYNTLKQDIQKYKKLPNITPEEIEKLDTIQTVFKAYLTALPLVNSNINQSTNELDKMVKISDTPAINAVKMLTSNIYGLTASYWFTQSTQRINAFKEIETTVAKDLRLLIEEKLSKITLFLTVLIILIIVTLAIILLSSTYMTRKITISMAKFQEGLGYFFQYTIREKDYLKPMSVEGSDEFAQMTKDMNQQIKKTEHILEQDKKVVLEISDIMEKVSNGFFQYTIHEKGATKEVESLRNIINDMVKETSSKMHRINQVLDSYASGKYSFTLQKEEKKGMYGDFGTLLTASLLLGQSTSELIAMIKNAGDELDRNTQTLTSSSKTLSDSSNAQAASLEQTAASIEEVTTNLKSNSQNIINMANIADELNSTADVGQDLATQTATSMEDINSQVSSISEAIEVIDQISFQTNILSLNAAVEAATAGEAGKGFAVVAQEVRNLASRSAEAAKEIKALVENASQKTQHGSQTANNMIEGYEKLSDKIKTTKSIIDEVTGTSKEQENSMIQINEAINQLDRETHKNTTIASEIDRLAKEVSGLSGRLVNITSRASIDPKYYEQVKDLDLMQEVSKYKNDHINFKKKYFETLDSFETCTVVNCQSCNMGKWILQCETQQRLFINSQEWNALKASHTVVHKQVQEFLNINANKESNEQLKNVGDAIERATEDVFNHLNSVLAVNNKLSS